MESNRTLRAIATIVFLGFASASNGTTITYNVDSLSANSWQYIYSVINDTLGADVEEFTIYFDLTRYANLAVTASPAGWDSLVVQPDPGLPDNGFFDSLALGAGIAPGAGLSGFAVSFDYLGGGAPGAQPFDIVNPVTFAILESGTTSGVPEPGTLVLLIGSLAALASSGRISRRR